VAPVAQEQNTPETTSPETTTADPAETRAAATAADPTGGLQSTVDYQGDFQGEQ